MTALKEIMLKGNEFIVTCETVPGRGHTGRSVDEAAELGKNILAEKLPVHAISITDNPGGNPAVSPDILASELRRMGMEALIHFSCTDANRNMIESRASALTRDGLQNVLVITGDYPVGGYAGMAKPIFDLDSVQVIRCLKEMNAGLEIPGRKKGSVDKLPASDFFIGCVVSPFKHTEAELMTQFAKLEKKVAAGADFIIPQLGYDVRKFAEVLKYMKYRHIDVPILGNVYVLSKSVAKLMNKGHIPGCVVSDELLRKLEEEADAPDKGKGARLERAAQMMAVFKGMKFNGVHIGGFGLKCADYQHIIERAGEIGDNWREHIPNLRFQQKDEFFLFPDDPELSFTEDKVVPVDLPKKKVFSLHLGMSRIFHTCVFTEGARGYKIWKAFYKLFAKWHTGGVIAYFMERQIKRILFDCQECGDCALFDLAYLCPMAKCAKFQRNGPCGGSKNGLCEVDVDGTRKCVWVMAYDRLSSMGKLDYIRTEYVPPVDNALSDTSSWANFFMGRDHTAKKPKAE
jgi:methylenetetrahydrofolate reductase (NADPH)